MITLIEYIDEKDVLLLRQRLGLDNNYLSRGSLLYILNTVKDLYDRSKERLVNKTAYLLINIIREHPFVDGNKRTAFGIADIFLRINGYCIDVEPEDGIRFIIKVASNEYNEHEVRRWLKEHLKRLEDNNAHG